MFPKSLECPQCGTRMITRSKGFGHQEYSVCLHCRPDMPTMVALDKMPSKRDILELSAAPENPTVGLIWMDKPNKMIYVYDGSGWMDCGTIEDNRENISPDKMQEFYAHYKPVGRRAAIMAQRARREADE